MDSHIKSARVEPSRRDEISVALQQETNDKSRRDDMYLRSPSHHLVQLLAKGKAYATAKN